MLAVQTCCDPMVERERVPGKPSTRSQGRGHPLERAASISPARQMQKCSKRAIDQRRGHLEREIAHIAFSQIELDPGFGRTVSRLLEHRRG